MNKPLIVMSLLFSFSLFSAETCSDKVKKIEDLDITTSLVNEFNVDFPGAQRGFQSNEFYYLFYQNPSKNNVIFMGTGHSGLMVGSKKTAINSNVLSTIIKIKNTQNIKTIIVERNQEQVDEFKEKISKDFCQNAVCLENEKTGYNPKRSILDEGEASVAIWTARKTIDVVGGEPTEKDFTTILTSIVGLSMEDYDYTIITACLEEQKVNQTNKVIYDTFEKAYDFCTNRRSLVSRQGEAQRVKYQTWFAEKAKELPYPYLKAPICQKTGNNPTNCVEESACKDITVDTSSIKSIFDSNGCYVIKLTEDTSNKKSIPYIFAMIHKVKNFCLVKNIVAALDKGNVFVIYGSAHLYNTYKALTKEVCPATASTDTTKKCPLPVEDIKKI